jgi:hypothetical protein
MGLLPQTVALPFAPSAILFFLVSNEVFGWFCVGSPMMAFICAMAFLLFLYLILVTT